MGYITKLNTKIENCYGIKKLEHVFDFSKGSVIAVYAANGIMKTSFAKTLKALANKETPHDLINSTLIPVYDLFLDETQNQIPSEEIFVIEPYNEKSLDSEDKILILLADENVRKEYLSIYKELDSSKKILIKSLKTISGSSNCEEEIVESFSSLTKINIFEVFEAILGEINDSSETFSFRYNDIFDPDGKVLKFLEKNSELFQQYINKYEELIAESDFFSKQEDSVFGTTEAKNIKNSLDGGDYFSAGHKLNLKTYGEVDTSEKYSEILHNEINKIFNEEGIRKVFEQIDKALDANKELKAFKKLIEKDNALLLRLGDFDSFRREVWFSFLKQVEGGVTALVELYNNKKPDIMRIIEKANEDRPKWEEAITEFKNRFVNIPFTLSINNQTDAVLNAVTPVIDFKFDGKSIDRKGLLEVLSQGERRAFYLLNIIFGIKALKLNNKKALFIIDDIADSFDYKNKYAIVEYLNDLTKDENFCSIILTHNFDFFRTVQSRILQDSQWDNSFLAEKSTTEIKLMKGGSKDVTDPFSIWRKNLNNNLKYLIASIPLVRNLIEFREGNSSEDFKLLTHVLHDKREDTIKDSNDIVLVDIEPIFKNILKNVDFEFANKEKIKVVDTINVLSENIYSSPNPACISLEDKIILSIATRLKAERYMWSQVTDKEPFKVSQTGKLFERFKYEYKEDVFFKEKILLLEKVIIMTPENIHLNSFMYEPILDMGIDELKELYMKICHFT